MSFNLYGSVHEIRLRCQSWRRIVIDCRSSWGPPWNNNREPTSSYNSASAACRQRETTLRYSSTVVTLPSHIGSSDLYTLILYKAFVLFCEFYLRRLSFCLLFLFQAELVATTSEFESYKVRVHNVLKQQKTKTTAQGEGDGGKQDRWATSWTLYLLGLVVFPCFFPLWFSHCTLLDSHLKRFYCVAKCFERNVWVVLLCLL